VVAAVQFNQIKSATSWARPDFPLGSKAGFHSSEGDDGAHLEVQVVVVGGGEDAEQRRRCWKQISVAGSGNLTKTSRARRKIDSSSALFFLGVAKVAWEISVAQRHTSNNSG
jgi:hypothetical protein